MSCFGVEEKCAQWLRTRLPGETQRVRIVPFEVTLQQSRLLDGRLSDRCDLSRQLCNPWIEIAGQLKVPGAQLLRVFADLLRCRLNPTSIRYFGKNLILDAASSRKPQVNRVVAVVLHSFEAA